MKRFAHEMLPNYNDALQKSIAWERYKELKASTESGTPFGAPNHNREPTESSTHIQIGAASTDTKLLEKVSAPLPFSLSLSLAL